MSQFYGKDVSAAEFENAPLQRILKPFSAPNWRPQQPAAPLPPQVAVRRNPFEQMRHEKSVESVRAVSERLAVTKAETKKAAPPKKKELSDALKREQKFSHSIAEFTKTGVVLPVKAPVAPPPPAPLTPAETRFAAESDALRTIAPSFDGACGNSPFCTCVEHEHELDDTLLGLVEERVRRSQWAKSRDLLLADGAAVVPGCPFSDSECGFVVDTDAKRPSRRMTGKEFRDGVERGDLATLVLGHTRLFCVEARNVTESLSADIDAVEVRRQRQLAELEAAQFAGGAAHASINAHANDECLRLGCVATDRLRILRLTASEQLRKLLLEHEVPRAPVVHASLLGIVTGDIYSCGDELKVLDVIRGRLAAASESGPLVGTGFAPQPWNLAKPVLAIESPPKKRKRSDSRSEASSSTEANASTVVITKAGRSQFAVLPRCDACTSICIEVVATMVDVDVEAQQAGVTPMAYITDVVDWDYCVQKGVAYWVERPPRKDAKDRDEHSSVFDLLRVGARGALMRERFELVECGGSMFDAKTTTPPQTDEAKLQSEIFPDLETALERFAKEAGARPFGCVLTFHGHSVAVCRTSAGWHVFDSLGNRIAGHSAIMTVPTLARVRGVVDEQFNLDALEKDSSPDALFSISFSAVSFIPKK